MEHRRVTPNAGEDGPLWSHGWRVVAFCFLAAVFAWGLGVFGASVYLHLTAALVLPAVGAAIDRHGARPVIAGGAGLRRA
jgi:hypothetical protein